MDIKAEFRKLYENTPDGGSRSPKTPPLPIYKIHIPHNSVFFCRLSRRYTLRSKNRLHYGKRYVFVRNYQTSGDILIDGIRYTLNEGEGFLICPHQFHNYERIQDESMTWFFWAFDLINEPNLLEFSHRTLKVTPEIDKQLLDLSKEYLSNINPSPAEANELSLRGAMIFNNILEANSFQNQILSIPKEAKDSINFTEFLSKINNYINEHIYDAIKPADIAKSVGYSDSHLRRLFKQHVGMSLGVYIREMRIKKSISKIIASNQNMTEIAYECGFKSLSSFYRIFKEATGVAPKEYRKLYISKQLDDDSEFDHTKSKVSGGS